MKEKSSKIKELEKLIAKAYLIKQRKKIIDEEYKESSVDVSSKIASAMDSLGITEYEFEADGQSNLMFQKRNEILRCKKVVQRTVVYNPKAVYEKAGKSARKVLIDKTYKVNDMEGLIDLLKSNGVNPKEFKKFIDVEMSVNEKRLEQLYQTGIVSLKDLQGCYTIKTKSSYLSIKSISSEDKER